MPDKPSDDMPGIERIRQIVSLHPWIDARQAAILSGYSRRYADRCLARLIAQGAVQTCRTFGLCTSGKLYAPAGRVIQLANGLTGQDMARALLHIEALWGTRNLLAILAGGDQVESQSGDPARQCAYRGRLLWSASPAKVRYLNARGKPVTLRLPAQGIVAQDGRFIPFVIEWDLGEIVLEGLAQRFAGLCRWSQSAEYRGYQERFPVIVMVTVNERRMWQLLWLWQCTRTRYHAPPLPFYIGVWREIVEERPDAWHSAGSGVSRVTLFQGARAAWPAWRPAPMVQVKPSRRSARDALVQVHLGIPSRQARGVLRCVAAWPLLTSDEVAAVLNLHLREAQISLKGLRELGLIEIFPLEGRLGYTLSPTGIQVLAAANGLSPAQYARWRYWPIAKHCRPLRLNLPVLVTCLGHTRAVRAFFVSLARHARRCRQELALDHALVAWDETESRRSYLYRGRRWTLAPDSSGLYRIGDQQYSFFLEIDRGTAWLPRLRRKFGNYYTYLTSGEFRRDGYRLPQVLIVVPDEGRANVVRGVILYEARVHGCSPLPAWIAIQGTLDERGPAAPVWREVMRWRFEHCFEGFRDPPDSARMVLDLASMRCRRRRSP